MDKEEGVSVTAEENPDIEIDIIDDTPEADKGRPVAKETGDASEVEDGDEDDELDKYSGSVQKRIKKLTKGFNDERRAKEAAVREREEAVKFAQHQFETTKKLQKQLSEGSEVLVNTSREAADQQMEAAKRGFKDAYDSGDSDKIADAQEAISKATLKKDQSSALRPLQFEEDPVYNQPQEQQVPTPDTKALDWQEENEWFGTDKAMTGFALGLHTELVEAGIDPRTNKYYEKVNARMREVFPGSFPSESDPVERANATPNRARSGSVVASAARSTASKRVSLTASQVALAKRLGLTNAQYAHELMKLGA
jgi:hypothetical protein